MLCRGTIIKMFALAERKTPISEIVRQLNIVPVSIAYEYDPCDYTKAKELYLVAESGSYQKPPGEDLMSLAMGLRDFKGKVHLRFGSPLDGDFETADEVAGAIDRQILDNYQLYYINYWALRELATSDIPDTDRYSETWLSLDEQIEFPSTLDFQVRHDNCPHDHRIKWLEMYANPVVNKFLYEAKNLKPV